MPEFFDPNVIELTFLNREIIFRGADFWVFRFPGQAMGSWIYFGLFFPHTFSSSPSELFAPFLELDLRLRKSLSTHTLFYLLDSKKSPWFYTLTLAFTFKNSFLLIVLPYIQTILSITLISHCAKGLTCIISLDLPNIPLRKALLLFPFYRWGIWGLEKWTDFSRSHSGGAGLQVQVIWFQSQ